MFCIVYVSIFCVTWIPFGSHLLRLNIFKTWNLQNMKYFLQGGCCVAAFVLHKLWGSVAFANPADQVHGQQQHQLGSPHPRQKQEWPSPWVSLGQLDPHYHGRYQHNFDRTKNRNPESVWVFSSTSSPSLPPWYDRIKHFIFGWNLESILQGWFCADFTLLI